MIEEWRPCPEFVTIYEVSSKGRVRRKRPATGTRIGKILKPWMNKGRPAVKLSVRCVTTNKLVHQLICEAWHGACPSSRHQVAHWDGNTKNNTPNNLRWATQKENEDDKKRHGRYKHAPQGSRHKDAKLSEADIPKIRNLNTIGISTNQIAKQFNVSWPCINRILKKRGWTHV